MKQNYFDGIEYLIKQRVCILTETALQQSQEGHRATIHEKFAKLVKRTEQLNISYFYEDANLSNEQQALSYVVRDTISFLKQHPHDLIPYQVYLWSLDVLSVCVYCPYIIKRSEIYEFWQYCVSNNII